MNNTNSFRRFRSKKNFRYTCLSMFDDFGILRVSKKPFKIGKLVNFSNFRKMHPPLPKGGLLEWAWKKGVTLCDTQLFFTEITVAIVFQEAQQLQKKGVSCKKHVVQDVKGLFWFGCCVACFVLNGWLCGVSVLLLYFCSSLNVLWFLCCVFGWAANVLKMVVFPICFCLFGWFFSSVSVRWAPCLFCSLPYLGYFFWKA